jgi:hypothetical protein
MRKRDNLDFDFPLNQESNIEWTGVALRGIGFA